ncbi:polysaccharide deacetylase family protein [Paenibacillus glacialis]|uniref:NodB homology domain-containing protein n=1 Tax=Paenibacillus glacialis TaxID=494026 RepID=A0A168NNJ3_9BACL|nr:polysaccharide deacetylase family protein [Paenibacillus glacialis]OAB45968.1 hypothetical protein PGLA_00800 [Paenibacillus glacialis]
MDKGSKTYTIHVNFTFEETVLMQWELDAFTADHIIAITGVSERVKYRLSLQCYFNATFNYHYSYITKYDRGISEKVMFPCSESYSIKISTLRDIQSLNLLLPSSSIVLQQHASALHKEPMESTGIIPLKFSRRLKPLLSRMLVSTVIIAMLSFLFVPEYSYISERVFANVFTNSSELTDKAVMKSELNTVKYESNPSSPSEENVLASVILQPSEVPKPISAPEIILDQSVNFNLPSGSVALTFDDGPSIYTKEIVDVLKKYGVGGTFFFVGSQVRKFPEAVKYADANGFSIGNHSMTHSNLSQLSATIQQYEIEQTNQLIQQITSNPVLLFRPPYGSRDDKLTDLMTNNNMKMVLWNKDPEDWNNSNSQKILNYIINTHSTGSIILLHESKETLKALPFIIEFLQKQQLEISSLI